MQGPWLVHIRIFTRSPVGHVDKEVFCSAHLQILIIQEQVERFQEQRHALFYMLYEIRRCMVSTCRFFQILRRCEIEK